MRLVICVKHVPASSASRSLDPSTFRLDRAVDSDLNPPDSHALEEALTLRDKVGASEVVAVSMGPERAADTLRSVLALGADRAVLVSDPAAAGSDLIATSRILAGALSRERPDLIFFGQQADDSDGGLLAAAVAERLSMPMVSKIAHLEILDGRARAKRRAEGGYDLVEAPLPCIVSVLDGVNDPRYPSLRSALAARSKEVEHLSLADLGVVPGDVGEAGSQTTIRGLGTPTLTRERRTFPDDGRGAERILEFLIERGVVG